MINFLIICTAFGIQAIAINTLSLKLYFLNGTVKAVPANLKINPINIKIKAFPKRSAFLYY